MSIEVPTTTNTGGIYTGKTPTTAPKQQMDSEVFMKLLVAQLKNQDPSSPMDTNQMMSQQTQMASLEQLVSLTDTSREQFALSMRVAAMSIVGREVSYTGTDGKVVTGKATGASFASEVPSITVGSATVNLDKILSIVPSTAV